MSTPKRANSAEKSADGPPWDPVKLSAEVEKLTRRLAAETAERRRLQEALSSLPNEILIAQDKERRRIAAELHDGVNQILSSAKFRLAHAEGKLTREAGEAVIEARQIVERAIRELRRISKNLRPSELDDFGLVAAIEELVQEFRDRTAIEIEFKRGSLPKRLPPQVELAIYRILQEALANIEQHADARKVTASLNVAGKFAMLNVIDDGRGFADPQKARPDNRGRGLGIINMRERTQALGGVFAMKSAPGKGTEITVHVKLQN